MRTKSQLASPPLYELYGELGRDAALDGLHVESIADRSRLHNWEIRPHRHASLVQLLLIESGLARVRIDALTLALPGPAVIWVPTMVIHGFEFSPETVGHVVTMDQARVRALVGSSRGLWEALGAARAASLDAGTPAERTLQAAATALRDDYAGTSPWRSQVLDGALLMVAALVARLAPLASSERLEAAEPAGRAMQHLARFREQVERHFRSHPSLDALARPLGITPTQLNRICRRHLNSSALDVLHQRLLLEAKRELGYTTLQVRQIADGLGFADPAYFTRFFQRLTGQSPSAWREQPRTTG
jgi:AraC family transcriptional activator of pobA